MHSARTVFSIARRPGQPSRLKDEHRQVLAAVIESGPIPDLHGVVRGRIVDFCQWLYEEFRVTVSKQTLSRELRGMGYHKLKSVDPADIELWFGDEARIGQNTAGRPQRCLDFQRQYNLKPARCQRITVSGKIAQKPLALLGDWSVTVGALSASFGH